MKIIKYCYHHDVILKSSTTTFLLGTIKIELQKAYFLDDLVNPNMLEEIQG